MLNTETSLLFKKNFLKLYDSRYLTLGYSSEIINGLNMELSAGYEERRVLRNTTSYSLIKYSRAYTDNNPVNSYLSESSGSFNALRDQRHVDIISRVIYTPRQKYWIHDGNKMPLDSDWPTFSFTWQHGINEFSDLSVKLRHFDMIRFEVQKSQSIGAFAELRWRIRTGGFLDNRSLPYYDFFHFNSQPIKFLLDDYQDAFMLPAYYSMSTPEFFGEGHLKYTTPYLILKLLPVLSNTLMRENLSIAYLGSRFHKSYSEIGYSLSEVLLMGEIGVYLGFEDLKYKSIGGKIVFRFN
jgi:hypothetical protein